jgi:hypothetical protein
MQDTVEIARRYCGPPDSGNGGYVAGLLASRADRREAVTVRLRRPPPLEAPLDFRRTPAGVIELVHGGEVLASAEPGVLAQSIPVRWTTFEVAQRLSRNYPGFHRHPFPTCFVCGPDRAHGDGLRIFPGPWHAGHVVAPWVPHAALDRGDGTVAPEHLWAALDCPGYFAAAQDGRPMLLGQITARLGRPVRIDEPCIVIGWRLGSAGRKHCVGTAIYGKGRQLRGVAEALWIEPRTVSHSMPQSIATISSSCGSATSHAA